MARPGFVLEVDDRTPPLVVPEGDGFRLERFPLGTRVVYPAESLTPVADIAEAIGTALDSPLDSAPLAERLHPGMKLTVAFDDVSSPLPKMHRPDIRGRIIEAVLSRAAAAGVDDVAVIAARGLRRRMTEAELLHILGERVFRSFYADGLLTHHDAEDTDQLTGIGSTEAGETLLNRRVAESDLLVFVHLGDPHSNGVRAVAQGLGSTATIAQFAAQPEPRLSGGDVASQVEDQIAAAVPVFAVEAVLDNAAYSSPLLFLGKREWEWNLKDQAAWLAVRRGLSVASRKARTRIMNSAQANYAPIQIAAGGAAAVARTTADKVRAQRVVEVNGQADVGIVGVPHATPASVDSITNPVLAAWSGLGEAFGAHTGQPVVRAGGALVLYHPMPIEFSALHHPSYVDFFADVLSTTTDAVQIQEKFEHKFATDPWYSHLYRTSFAFHGVHPFHLWYQLAAARAHCGDIIWVGAHRPTVERLGFRAASTLADALEIVSSTVGRAPSITYLHGAPQLIADVR
ncbi:MAG: lactate racemase domain-containing protein [Propionibacteriaceae bacterium]